MGFLLIQQPTFEQNGLQVKTYPFLTSPTFQKEVNKAFRQFKPALHANNKLCRAVRWGVLANDQILFSTRNTYQLSAKFNPEESGRTRIMDLIPDSLLCTPQIQQLIRDVFKTFHPEGNSYLHNYIVQLSAIRYAPTPSSACYPSPDMPYQDGFNNGIIVLNKTPNLTGGRTRIYNMNNQLLYEADLKAGQGVFVEDTRWKHQVEPMLINTQHSGANAPCHRDILIIRIDPAKR